MASVNDIAFVSYACEYTEILFNVTLLMTLSHSSNKSIVDEVTTLRRHLDATHAVSAHYTFLLFGCLSIGSGKVS
jgi:hypothetical protein